MSARLWVWMLWTLWGVRSPFLAFAGRVPSWRWVRTGNTHDAGKL